MSPRERKLVAVAILLGVSAVVWLGVIAPLVGGFADRAEQREDLRARYAANERLIARTPRLTAAAEQLKARGSAFGIAAPDAAQGGELLRERLEASLAAANGELRTSEVIETDAGWVRASASGLMSNDQMVAWLAALANQPPYLSVESLTVGADRAINSNRLDLMDVRIEATTPLLAAHEG